MDTPSSSPPRNSPTRQAKSRKTRGPTQMRGLARRFKTGKRIPLNVDPISGRVSGPNKVSFSSYLGTLARDKISILVPSWDKVPASTKNMIWQDILEYFDIANTPIIRNKILSSVAVKFRQHKSYLTREWIYGKYKGKCPCEKYNIDLQEWEKFKESRSDPSWEPIRKKAQTIQKLNDAPHVLSRGGYDRLVDNIMASELKRQKEGATQAGAGEDVAINPLHPPPRHKLWKMARTKQSGRMTSELASQIGEKIDLLEKQAAQGSFVPQGRHDILNAALGRPEHPGRVRGAGVGVTIGQYFGSRSHDSSTFRLSPQDWDHLIQQIKQDIKERLKQDLLSEFPQLKSLQSQIAPVEAIADCVSSEGSCAEPSTSDVAGCPSSTR